MADLQTSVCGIAFPNPVWTAAGPAAADANMLRRAAEGGAGGLVTKTLSVKPARVPIPNLSSPAPGSLLNAELWSEIDYRRFLEIELPEIRKLRLPVIVSVGYSVNDLARLGAALAEGGMCDAVEFSIHYVEKSADNLRRMAETLRAAIRVPVFAKFSPSIQNIAETVRALEDVVDGFVAINSVGPALDFDPVTLQPPLGSSDGRGWLSGRAVLPIGLHFVASISQATNKPVIGVGGIRTALDVVKYIMAGAGAVQVCTLAVLKGQNVYGQLASDLSKWMDEHGYASIEELRGAFHRRAPIALYTLGEGEQLHPRITYEKCTYCDVCVKGCVHEAICFLEREFLVDRGKCVSCGLCVSLCPTEALLMASEDSSP
jgi:dihydroorotate dehydrogenase (NAD+) catalytic subunit